MASKWKVREGLWLALALSLGHATAQSDWDVSQVKSQLSTTLQTMTTLTAQLETNYKCFTNTNATGCTSTNSTAGVAQPATWFASSGKFNFGGQKDGKVLDACGNELPDAWSPVCDRKIAGDTKGCECAGTKMVDAVVVKAVNEEFDSNAKRNAGNLAAFAADKPMHDAFKAAAAAQDYENKWLYFGAVDGSYALYPGRMWPRDRDGSCGQKYDPRIRPWYLGASNGPKNVIFILDSSGSMQQNGRMDLLKTAAKQVVDSLTFADYFGIVDFDSEARTMKGLNFLAPAASGFRMEAKIFIDKLEADGGTNYEDGFKRAFEMADTSYTSNYDSGCQTVYVFLTDGACTNGNCDWPAKELASRKERSSVKRAETHMVIGLGAGVENESSKKKLQELACVGEGIFTPVPDKSGSTGGDMRKAEFALVQALSKFATYLETKNALKKRELVAYSEVYGTSWDGVTTGMEVATAARPVYDKTDDDRWKFLGVAAVDVTVCALEQKLVDKNPTIQESPTLPEETKFSNCKCATNYVYKGSANTVEITDGSCISTDWPVAWCATENCGIPLGNRDSISTGYWADCKPFGARAVLEEQLKKSGEECGKGTDKLDACELEALRPADARCATSHPEVIKSVKYPQCTASEINTLKSYSYREKLPGFTTVQESQWKGNTGGTYESAKWSASEEGCDQCKNEAMRPQCALPPKCGKGIPVPQRSQTDGGGLSSSCRAVPGPWTAHALALVALLFGLVV